MSKEYRIVLNSVVSDRIDAIAKKVYVESEQLILFLLLLSLKDLETGVKSIPYYRKLLNKIAKKMDYEME